LAHPFFTADWHTLALFNYAIDPALLVPLLPAACKLDSYGGKTYLSLVGFRFERARVRGLWIPFHSDFDEVDLRFYVHRESAGEVRPGLAFVGKVVPRWALAQAARTAYGEKYVALPMRHRIAGPVTADGRRQVQYGWRVNGGWCDLRLECEGRSALPAAGSLEQFITRQYWGYAAQPDGATVEYRVEHDPWRIWRATSARFEGDCAALYGPALAACLKAEPDSALLAEGSSVAVYRGERI
jgi:uncharacterized protein YqjF (DUF2071 family)